MSTFEPDQPSSWEPPSGTPSGSPGPSSQYPVPPAQQYPTPPPQYPSAPPPQYPTAPAPGYGSGYPAPPVERKKRRWPWILVGILGLLVLLIGGCSWLVFRAASPSIDAANEWVALVDEQRWGEAYDALCPALRAEVDRADGEAELQNDFGAGIDAYRISSFQNTNGNVSVGGQITVGGDERPVTFRMDDDSGQWRVCGYGFQELDLG